MRSFVFIIFILFVIVSCEKDKDSYEIKFYEKERTIFLEESFEDTLNWEFDIYHNVFGDTAYVKLVDTNMVLYSYGSAHSFGYLNFNNLEADVICFEIAFKKFKGQYYPWGTSDNPVVTSQLSINFNYKFIYRDDTKGSLNLDNSSIQIKIDKIQNTYEIYRNDEDITDLFSLHDNYYDNINNELFVGSVSDDYYGHLEECLTIIDYVILYTVDSN